MSEIEKELRELWVAAWNEVALGTDVMEQLRIQVYEVGAAHGWLPEDGTSRRFEK